MSQKISAMLAIPARVGPVLVVGNAPVHVRVNSSYTRVVVFNQIYHMDTKWTFDGCPGEIEHHYNFLFESKVRARHAKLRSLCPVGSVHLRTTDGAWSFELARLPRAVQRCFHTERRKGWSIGFFILARYVAHWPAPVHVAAFTHRVWRGHPVECERQAVDAWVGEGRVVRV